MDWMTRMNEAIAYVETNLEGDIDLAKAGRLAGCSGYHFQRVFTYMAGVTLAEYIRRRRLTLAAFALQQTGAKVIDVALRYGYDSPTAFSRAFAAMHGMPPSKVQNSQDVFVAYPPISFQISIQGVSAMNYRIEEMDAFKIVGKKLSTTTVDDKGYREIPPFWGKMRTEGLIPQICPLMDRQPLGVLGASAGNWEKGTEFDYYIAVATTQPTPEGMDEYEVPAGTWAIFECVGPMPGAIQTLQKRIVTEWLPTSGYDYGKGPDIEVYADGDQNAADYKSWVWLPIAKAQ